MEASGRVPSLNTLQIVGSIHDHPVSDDDGEPCNSVLSDEQLLLLDAAYQIMIPSTRTSQISIKLLCKRQRMLGENQHFLLAPSGNCSSILLVVVKETC